MKKEMSFITIAFITTILISGCTAGIVGRIPQVHDNFATVYLARKSGQIGCNNAFLIKLNGEDFIRIECGMKSQFKIPAGEKIKISSASSAIPDVFFLKPAKGQDFYFGMDCNVGACWFDEVSREEYDRIAETCSKELVIEQGK